MIKENHSLTGVISAETGNRTQDTTIFSRVLYQLSYLGLRVVFYQVPPDVSRKSPLLMGKFVTILSLRSQPTLHAIGNPADILLKRFRGEG